MSKAKFLSPAATATSSADEDTTAAFTLGQTNAEDKHNDFQIQCMPLDLYWFSQLMNNDDILSRFYI